MMKKYENIHTHITYSYFFFSVDFKIPFVSSSIDFKTI
jgi:hypothetical protein